MRTVGVARVLLYPQSILFLNLNKSCVTVPEILIKGCYRTKGVQKRGVRLVYQKFIKRGNKLHGPYLYRSYRDPNSGRIVKEYVGKGPGQKTVRAKALAIGSSVLLLFIFCVILFGHPAGDGTSTLSQHATGLFLLEVNKVVSSEAFMQVDGVAQPIPLETQKVDEGQYVFNITTLDPPLAPGEHTVRIFDQGVVVFETNISVGNEMWSYNILEEKPIGNVRALEQVRWVQKISVLQDGDIAIVLPNDARLAKILDKEKKEKVLGIAGAKKDEEYTIEYETPGPDLVETDVNVFTKRVTVSSELNVTNVTAFADVPYPAAKEMIKLRWMNEGREHPIATYIDAEQDGLIERIEWQVPHLSEQTFEVSIVVLNVYTFLRDGEQWTVYFNTTGSADLIVTPKGSSFGELLQDDQSTFNELVFESVQCDATEIKENLLVNTSTGLVAYTSLSANDREEVFSLVYPNYQCAGTGSITNHMNKAGYAVLEFNFGGQLAYAIDPSITSVVLNTTNPNTNDTTENVTAYAFGASADVTGYVYNWFVNGTTFAALNVPMTNNLSSGSGQTTFDFSGYGAHGTLGNGAAGDSAEPTFTMTDCPLSFKGCYRFDGVNDYIDFSLKPQFNVSREMTLEAWINASSGNGVIFSRWFSNQEISFELRLSGGGYNFAMQNASGETTSVSLANAVLNQTQHIVFIHNRTVTYLYINGTLATTIENTPFFSGLMGDIATNNTASLFIGARSSGFGDRFAGKISDAKLYNRTLTGEQIWQNYLNGISGYNTTVAQQTFVGQNWSVAVTSLNASGWNGTTIFSNNVSILNRPEAVTLSTPLNDSFFNNNPVFLNWTASANIPGTATYFLFLNGTNRNATTALNMTMVLGEGYYDWTIIASDGPANSTFAQNQTFTVDTTPARTLFVLPTELNNTYRPATFVFVNSSVYDLRKLQNITFVIVNSSFHNVSTLVLSDNMTNISYNFSRLADGLYLYNVTVYDAAGNANTTETRTITLDTTKPRSLFVAPTDNASGSITNMINMNVSIYDAHSLQNSTFWLFNRTGIVNQTFYVLTSNMTNVSINFTNLNTTQHVFFYNMTVYDSAGNLNTTETRMITLNFPPSIANSFLNSTRQSTNATNQNLTIFSQGANDIEGDNITFNYNWRLNGTAIAVLNMPMTDAIYSNDNQTVFDFSTFNNYAILGNQTQGGTDEPVFTTVGCPTSGGCYQFDGSNDYMNLSQRTEAVNITNAATFEAWINKTSPSNGMIISRAAMSSNNICFNAPYCISSWRLGAVQVDTHSELFFAGSGVMRDSEEGFAFNTVRSFDFGLILLNRSTHVAVVFNGTDAIFYINGSQVGVGNLQDAPLHINNSFNIMIGADSDRANFFKGQIGSVKIYNRSLTSQQIWQNYMQGYGGDNVTVGQETRASENWSVAVTPIDYLGLNGSTVLSNNLTVETPPPPVTPQVVYITATANNSFVGADSIFVNVSVYDSDNNLANSTFMLFNTTGLVNTTVYWLSNNITNVSINFTNLNADMQYTYNMTVMDLDGQSNATELRMITLDNTEPVITSFTSSAGTSYDLGIATTLSCTATETNALLTQVSVTDGSTCKNNGATSCALAYTAPSGGEKIATCLVIDTVGNTKSESFTITVIGASGGDGSTPIVAVEASAGGGGAAAEGAAPVELPPILLDVGRGRRLNATIGNTTTLTVSFEEDASGVRKPRLDLSFQVGDVKERPNINPVYIPWYAYGLLVSILSLSMIGLSARPDLREFQRKHMHKKPVGKQGGASAPHREPEVIEIQNRQKKQGLPKRVYAERVQELEELPEVASLQRLEAGDAVEVRGQGKKYSKFIGYFDRSLIQEYNPQAYALLSQIREANQLASMEQELAAVRKKKQVVADWNLKGNELHRVVVPTAMKSDDRIRSLPEIEQLRILERKVKQVRAPSMLEKKGKAWDERAALQAAQKKVWEELGALPEQEQLRFVEDELEQMQKRTAGGKKLQQVVSGKVYYQLMLDVDKIMALTEQQKVGEARFLYEKIAAVFEVYQSFLKVQERLMIYNKLLKVARVLQK